MNPKGNRFMTPRRISITSSGAAKIRSRWTQLLQDNVFAQRLSSYPKLEALEDKTLAEFSSLLHTSASRRWSDRHRTHTRAIRELGQCGFPVALVYFAMGEQAVFEHLRAANRLAGRRLADARILWRYLAQREIQSQCVGCGKVCAAISHFSNSFQPLARRANLPR
jgi:hypothetical protein